MMIGFDVEMPDAVADQLIRSAGFQLAEADYPLALALAVLYPLPAQLREYLLAPDHAPVSMGVPTLLTTSRSATKVSLMLSAPAETAPPPEAPRRRRKRRA